MILLGDMNNKNDLLNIDWNTLNKNVKKLRRRIFSAIIRKNYHNIRIRSTS